MDEQPIQNTPPDLGKPVIPPPDLTPHGPETPLSPMDDVRKTPPVMPEHSDARVNMPHGVEIVPAQDAVPINSRIIAGVIDILVVIGISMTIGYILPSSLAWITAMAYLLLRDSMPFLDGQSLGKKAMKIRAVTLDGQSLVGKWEPALIRNAVLIIPFFGLIELIILLTREGKPDQGRRLGDEWGKTKVILEQVDVGTQPPTV